MDFFCSAAPLVGMAALQEQWNIVTLQAMRLASETHDVVFAKNSFQEFSGSISQLTDILQALDARKVEANLGPELTKISLHKLTSQLRRACEILEDCRSGSRLRILLKSSMILTQIQDLAKEIAQTISSLQLVNLNIGLNIKTAIANIINDLGSMEFKSSTEIDRISSEIENMVTHDKKNHENTMELLEKIMEAVGASTNVTFVQRELAILKEEKEEMEAQKKQAEALQLSQLIQLLSGTEVVTRPVDENVATFCQNYPIDSFICPLSNELMEDPVAILCGHSFERKAIQEHFGRGERICPACQEELPSLDITPNLSLRGSIKEWKQRDMDLNFQAAIRRFNSNDNSQWNEALEKMQFLLRMPRYLTKFAEENLIPKLVGFLGNNTLNTAATLNCLNCLARHSEDSRESIVEAGAIRPIIKHLYKGEIAQHAVAILLELSSREKIADLIGGTKNCIPILVSMLHHNDTEVSEKAHKVLQNLSFNTAYVIKMAISGYFKPFVSRFTEGSQETRALMAADLVAMQLKEHSIKDLVNEQFIKSLVQMLFSSSPAYKSASLQATKKLMANPEIFRQLLADPMIIPLLLGHLTYVPSDLHLKEEALELIALLVKASKPCDFQIFQGLKELQSENSVNLFLRYISDSEPQTSVKFIELLVELSHKSEQARCLVRLDDDAITYIYSCLENDQPAVKRGAMKLLYCICEGHLNGVPLPSVPRKEAAINSLVSILTHSPDTEERSIAAAIIGELPKDDVVVDNILRKSEVLKAIHEIFCGTDMEQNQTRDVPNSGQLLLENALAALLHYTEPTKHDLQKQVCELELFPSLVRVLSSGSSVAKQRAAIAMAHLSQSTSLSLSQATDLAVEARKAKPIWEAMSFLPKVSCCFSASLEARHLCSVHGTACSPKEAFCLIKTDAVKPLIRALSETEPSVQEAALMALETLLTDDRTLTQASAAIADSHGIGAILLVLEKGSLSAKSKALDLFRKILSHVDLNALLFKRTEGILIQLLHEEELKKKAALVLRQMKTIVAQSSYF